MIKHFPRHHLIAAGVMSAVVGVGLIVTPATDVEAKRITIPFDIGMLTDRDFIPPTGSHTPDPSLLESIARLEEVTAAETASLAELPDDNIASAPDILSAPTDNRKRPTTEVVLAWTDYEIQKGDSLATLFRKAGLDEQKVHEILGGDKLNKTLNQLYPGETLSFGRDANNQLQALALYRSKLEMLAVTLKNGKYSGEKVLFEPEIFLTHASGNIKTQGDSLITASKRAGMPGAITNKLAAIFDWDIDFAQDIQPGDQFNVVYEQLYLDGEKIGTGRILAAGFRNQGKDYKAVLYTGSDGISTYYTPEGLGMRKAFIRTPVDFARISSHFNLARHHPILHRIRAHKGTDYAASTGTPIKATGDGKVTFSGTQGGYGNVVILQHANKITTLYAHMSRFAKNIRPGTTVRQGQVIGYVGASGLASGPHLHYEFLLNGQHKNSLTVSLPNSAPVPSKELGRFRSQVSSVMAYMEDFASPNQIAMTERRP